METTTIAIALMLINSACLLKKKRELAAKEANSENKN